MSSHVESPDEEPLSSLVLTDGDETILATASESTDDGVDHDVDAETAEIEDAIEAVEEGLDGEVAADSDDSLADGDAAASEPAVAEVEEVLDPVEGVKPGSHDDYFSIMRRDLATLRPALGCR